MINDDSVMDPVAALAEEFIARYRNGERPPLSEYEARCPEQAKRIRELFPTLVTLEQANFGTTPGGSAAAPSQLERVGGYRILREVGRGGMGVVYEAEQESLGRRVALKVLPLHAAGDGSALERFRREARAAARLHHTNIVPVYEVGEENGLCFYAMQFIQGQPLDAVIKELKKARYTGSSINLPGSDPSTASDRRPYHCAVARIGMQAAEALDYAHREGVIHRDVKPSNLLLDAEGRVWVADFGLAKVEGSSLTQTGDVVGTLRYVPPERFNGWADPRSDVYSLGLTLYELLTLKPAFEAPDQFKLIQQVMHHEPTPPRRLDPSIPSDLETILVKAIDKEPAARYSTAAEMAADLQRFTQDQPILARRVGSAERLGRWCRRNPMIAALVTTLALVLVAGLVGVTSQWRRAERNAHDARDHAFQAGEKEREATRQRDEARTANENLRVALNRLRQTSFVSDMNLAQHTWDVGGVARVRELLEQYLPTGDAPDLRGFEWHYLHRLCHSDLRTLHFSGSNVAISADGKRFAVSSVPSPGKLEVTVWDVEADRQVCVLEGTTHRADHLTFSPDGNNLALVPYDNTVQVWNLSNPKDVVTLKGHISRATGVAFSPDGSRLVSGDRSGVVRGWEWKKRRELYSVQPWPNGRDTHQMTFAFSPDGQRLAGVAPLERVKLWDAHTGAPLLECQGYGHSAALAFSPDGQRLASIAANHQIVFSDARTGKPSGVLDGHTEEVESLAFSPDGKRLVSASWDRTVKVWDADALRELFTLRGHSSGVVQACFNTDGTRVVSTNGTEVKTWDARTGLPAYVVFTDHTDHARGVAFSPDGKHLASASDDGTIRIRALDTGEVVHTLKRPPSVRVVAYSSDGRRIVGAGGTLGAPVQVWDSQTGKALTTIQPKVLSNGINALAYSPDGKQLALSGSGQDQRGRTRSYLILVDATTGQEGLTLQEYKIDDSVAFSPDGRWVAAVDSDGALRIWDAKSAQQVVTLRDQTTWADTVVFSPDGASLASASRYGTIWVGDPRTGRTIHVLKGHTEGVTDVVFSPDGRRLASASHDRTVKVWDLTTGRETLSLKGHTGWVMSVAFSPDGKRLASGGWDHTVRMWDAAPVRSDVSNSGK